MAGKDEGGEAGFGNLYAELFIKLTDQALLRGFVFFNLTAGEFPVARQLFTTRPLSYENAAVDVDQRGRSDQNYRLGDSFGLHAGLIARGAEQA
jgi:hypothetical protein